MLVTHSQPPAIDAEAHLGEQVRTARDSRGWSQKELAGRLRDLMGLGLDQSAIARLERGQRSISFSEAVALAQLLNIDISMYASQAAPLTAEDYETAKAREAQLSALIEACRDRLEALRTGFYDEQERIEAELRPLVHERNFVRASIYGYEHGVESQVVQFRPAADG